MGLTQDIERLIQEKESEISKLKHGMTEINIKIEAAKAYIQGLRDILPRAQKEGERAKRARVAPPSELRSGSAPALVKELLESRGAPLHIGQIVESIGKENTKENRVSLGSTLARYVRDGVIFTRPAPNTFGLKEMTVETAHTNGEDLPEDFGN